MEERPIIFSALLIPGLLDGSKTQTRRVIKPQPSCDCINPNWHGQIIDWKGWKYEGREGWFCYRCGSGLHAYDEWSSHGIICPYGQVGDRLWCKETWAIARCTVGEYVDVMYKADQGMGRLQLKTVPWFEGLKLPKDCDIWHSGRFMPRWASRILLEITEVRVERLQEITDADAIASGASVFPLLTGVTLSGAPGLASARYAYLQFWDSLNAKRGYPWSMNPWPWVLAFRRVDA